VGLRYLVWLLHCGAVNFPQAVLSDEPIADSLLDDPAVFEKVVNGRIHHAALRRKDIKDRDLPHGVPEVLIPGEAPGLGLLEANSQASCEQGSSESDNSSIGGQLTISAQSVNGACHA
jgi:hypothetical protein